MRFSYGCRLWGLCRYVFAVHEAGGGAEDRAGRGKGGGWMMKGCTTALAVLRQVGGGGRVSGGGVGGGVVGR